jgi:hypothetical protein
MAARSRTRDSAGVYVLQMTHPDDFDRVCAFLRSVHIVVRDNGNGTITVSAPGAPTPLHERRELNGYVTTWNALNPAHAISLAEA